MSKTKTRNRAVVKPTKRGKKVASSRKQNSVPTVAQARTRLKGTVGFWASLDESQKQLLGNYQGQEVSGLPRKRERKSR